MRTKRLRRTPTSPQTMSNSFDDAGKVMIFQTMTNGTVSHATPSEALFPGGSIPRVMGLVGIN